MASGPLSGLSIMFYLECRKFISEALTLLKLLRGQIQHVRHAQLYRLKLSNITRYRTENMERSLKQNPHSKPPLFVCIASSICILAIIGVVSILILYVAKNVIQAFQVMFL